MSVDPMRGSSRRPDTQSPYRYAGQSPVDVIDPSGLSDSINTLGVSTRSFKSSGTGKSSFFSNPFASLVQIEADCSAAGGASKVASDVLQTYSSDVPFIENKGFTYYAGGLGLRFSFRERGLRRTTQTRWVCSDQRAQNDAGALVYALTSGSKTQKRVTLYRDYFELDDWRRAGVRIHELGHAILVGEPDEELSVAVRYRHFLTGEVREAWGLPLTIVSGAVAGAALGPKGASGGHFKDFDGFDVGLLVEDM